MPFIASADTTPEKTRTEPHDRSIPAVTITYVAPIPMTTNAAASVAMLRILITVAKAPGLSPEKTPIIPARTKKIHSVLW
jgi:hypothetical protein